MRAAGITARGEPVEMLEVNQLAPAAADEVLLDVVAAEIGNGTSLSPKEASRTSGGMRGTRRRPDRRSRRSQPSHRPSRRSGRGQERLAELCVRIRRERLF